MLIHALIKEIPFFWDFTEEERRALIDRDSFFSTYPDGDYLVTEGDEDQALFVLLKGEAKVVQMANPERIIAMLAPGAVMGEVSFLTRRKRSTHVISVGESIVFRIDSDIMNREHLDPALQTKIKNQLIEILVQRLEETNKALISQKEANLTLTKALRDRVMQHSA
ncbi:MAG: cyclic nucleotide-binding domain-containing protein [Magnetococcales bacterium]|nr:cyclic nucleotide-binding domain-containing protein [Magnetococcales bacterium]